LGFSLYCIYEIRWKFAPNNGSKYSNVFFFLFFLFFIVLVPTSFDEPIPSFQSHLISQNH
jgi:hypothetical protein